MSDLSGLRGHADWKWYGYAGHLMVARDCAYHLCTRVGPFLISTVGAYYSAGSRNAMETIGAGADDFFETYVFRCDGEKSGDPVILDYGEIDSERYAESRDAESGHYRFCWKYHNKTKDKAA